MVGGEGEVALLTLVTSSQDEEVERQRSWASCLAPPDRVGIGMRQAATTPVATSRLRLRPTSSKPSSPPTTLPTTPQMSCTLPSLIRRCHSSAHPRPRPTSHVRGLQAITQRAPHRENAWEEARRLKTFRGKVNTQPGKNARTNEKTRQCKRVLHGNEK